MSDQADKKADIVDALIRTTFVLWKVSCCDERALRNAEHVVAETVPLIMRIDGEQEWFEQFEDEEWFRAARCDHGGDRGRRGGRRRGRLRRNGDVGVE